MVSSNCAFFKKWYILPLFLFLFLLPDSQVIASQYFFETGNLNLFIGKVFLDKGDWNPVEKQTEFGVALDFKDKSWPFSVAIEFFHSFDDGMIFDPVFGNIEVTGETSEFNLGFRKIFHLSNRSRPFIGGGISYYVRGEYTTKAKGIEVSDFDETTLGFWCGTGIYRIIKSHFTIGLNLRYSNIEINLFDQAEEQKTTVGGIHIGGLIGYHW